jgi:hypothetical protein
MSAANYVARRYGVHSAMPSATAHRLCPHAVYMPPRIDYYAEISQQIHVIFGPFMPLVEPLSLDEAFLDVTGSEHLFGPATEIGRQITQEIRQGVRLVSYFFGWLSFFPALTTGPQTKNTSASRRTRCSHLFQSHCAVDAFSAICLRTARCSFDSAVFPRRW